MKSRQGDLHFTTIQVHPGVEAAGLFHVRLRLPRRGRRVQRYGLRSEEPEGVDVGAAQPDLALTVKGTGADRLTRASGRPPSGTGHHHARPRESSRPSLL